MLESLAFFVYINIILYIFVSSPIEQNRTEQNRTYILYFTQVKQIAYMSIIN